MTVDTGAVVPRSQISLGVEPTLRGSLAQLANGRVLVIDYFASRGCSVVIGDLTGDFEDTPPGPGYVELASIESVPVFAESRLLAILGGAGTTLPAGRTPTCPAPRARARPARTLDRLRRGAGGARRAALVPMASTVGVPASSTIAKWPRGTP